MGAFVDAAKAWESLGNIVYEFHIARKGKLLRIKLSFLREDFPHVSGIHYAKDVDLGINRSEYYGSKLIPALLHGKLDDSLIEKSRNWNRIYGRLNAVINLQSTFDGDFIIAGFDKKRVPTYSEIDAKFIIKSTVTDDIYFVFLDEKNAVYYCRSAFKKENIDYLKNQPVMTLLKKIKISNGNVELLYLKSGYVSE